MAVLRIVADIHAEDVEEVAAFYRDIFDLDVKMDMGWINTLGSDNSHSAQLSVASQGGSGAPVPEMSIEVDNIETVFERAKARGAEIAYPMTNEPWGVQRFFIKDPTGKLLNVLTHL